MGLVPKYEGGTAVWRQHFDRLLNTGLHYRHVALGTPNKNTATEEEKERIAAQLKMRWLQKLVVKWLNG